MQIKTQDLEQIMQALRGVIIDTPEAMTGVMNAIVLGQSLLAASRDPVDVVPVQDYLFPLKDHDDAAYFAEIIERGLNETD